jgi:N-acyl-D-amino-acid deacylase
MSRAMEDGAFGLSTGLIYAPGNHATTEEIVEPAKMLIHFGGIEATLMRSESERIRIDRESEASHDLIL